MANTTPAMTYLNPTTGNTPKKWYFQTTSKAPLQAKWSLPSRRSPGCVFKNAPVNLPATAWRKGRVSNEKTIKVALKPENWALLSLMAITHFKASYVSEAREEVAVPASPDKATQIIPMVKEETEETAINNQLVKSTIVSGIIWETNGTASGCWFLRASHQAARPGESQNKVLMLEHFNSDCRGF